MNLDKYAVIGHPIAHSKSPWIHSQFAKLTDEAIGYSLLESGPEPDAFLKVIQQFVEAGGKGVNVTMPFKEVAWSMADELSERAKLASAVNTLTFLDDGRVLGDTTDGVGLVNDLTSNMQLSLKQKRILIIGAGGAVKGVIQPLLEHDPEIIHIVNRTVQRAQELVEVFSGYGDISAGGYEDLAALGAFDVVINATPANFSGELPPISADVFASNSLAYDMSYAAKPTVFENWSSENGAARVSNGLGMLVEQAAESFHIWRNTRPPTGQVLSDLRGAL
jgi:shikimate dehydrogenase